MSNNYTGFSTMIACGSAAAATLLVAFFRHHNSLIHEDFDLGEIPERFPLETGTEVYSTIHFEGPDAHHNVWVGDGSNADVEEVSVYVNAVMQQCPEMPSPQGFAFSYWSDKARIDEFGGGCVVFARGHKPTWNSTTSMMNLIMKNRKSSP